MKKWQKEKAKEGRGGIEDLIHEELRYSSRECRRSKPHSIRDKHSAGTTKREVVVSTNIEVE